MYNVILSKFLTKSYIRLGHAHLFLHTTQDQDTANKTPPHRNCAIIQYTTQAEQKTQQVNMPHENALYLFIISELQHTTNSSTAKRLYILDINFQLR